MDKGKKRIRVLIAKSGLDGHSRGARVVALALREAGMEVIYTGLRQTSEQIANTAIQEDVDVIGLSILSGAHMTLCDKLMKKLREKGIEHLPVILGGVIPRRDIPKLKEIGITGVFPTESRLDDIINSVKQIGEVGQ